MRIEHPLGVTGGAGGVAEAAGGVLVEAAPGAVFGLGGDQVLVVLVQGDDPLHGRRLVHALQQQGRELGVGEDHAVLGVVDDPADLVGEQAWVEGVAHRPDPHDPVPDLQVTPGIPGQGRHPVARSDAHGQQRVRHPLGPAADLFVAGADDRAFERTGHDLARPMALCRVVENPVDRQRPTLHHSEHSDPPRARCPGHHGRQPRCGRGCALGRDTVRSIGWIAAVMAAGALAAAIQPMLLTVSLPRAHPRPQRGCLP